MHQKKKYKVHAPKGTQLYFLAIIPHELLADEITELKLFCSRHFDSSHALKSPPHITIVPPFRVNENELKPISELVRKSTMEISPFKLQLLNFNHFGNRVIYIDVPENKNLDQLHRQVHFSLKDTKLYGKGFDHRFSPHMTLAFRDLIPETFTKAWTHFKDRTFEAEFEVNQLFLLRHDGQQWNVIRSFPLAEN